MSSQTIKVLYLYLNCSEQYAGVSGNGDRIKVSLETFKEALKKFNFKDMIFNETDYKEDWTDYTEFIKKCIEFCETENKKEVVIQFG